MRHKQRTPDQMLQLAEQAWILRQQGYSMREVASELDMDVVQVHRLVVRARAAVYANLSEDFLAEKKRQSASLDNVIDEAMQEWERSREEAGTERTVTKETAVNADGKRVSLTPSEIKSATDLLTGFDPESAPGLFDADDNSERAHIVAAHTADHFQKRLAEIREDAANDSAARVVETTSTKTREWQCGDPRYLKLVVEAEAAKRAIWGIDAPKQTDLTSGGKSVTVVAINVLPSLPDDEDMGADK